MRCFSVLTILFLLFSDPSNADTTEWPPKFGFFSLPYAQQAGPLISFGQTLIGAKQTQIYVTPSFLKVEDGHYHEASMNLIHGITDNLALQLTLPAALSYSEDGAHSSGLGDMVLQMEYDFYSRANKKRTIDATLVMAYTLPSGSVFKDPPTGLGSPSFFGGLTLTKMTAQWYLFASAGGLLTSTYQGIHFGSAYYYQGGLGHVIKTVPHRYIFSFLVELDGEWSYQDTFLGIPDVDSGGNIVYVTPSLWYSNQFLFLQAGVSFPVSQHLNGIQPKDQTAFTVSIGFTFKDPNKRKKNNA